MKTKKSKILQVNAFLFQKPYRQFFNLSIFQFFNFLILPFLILNSSFLISQPSLDNLTYTYKANTNQLKYITDVVDSATSAVDLDNQNSTNYAYDASGQLTKDEDEGIVSITWTASGLVKQVSIDDIDDAVVVANRSLQFKYDAMGNRVKKIETDLTGVNPPLTTYYIRNATGALISVYKDEGSGVERKEVSIAVGTDNATSDSITNGVFSRNVGLKNYELKDHLGSVRVVINDVKEPVLGTTTFISNIKHSADFYSYGALMPGRDYNISSYRFGFQGKEKDDEAKGNGNSYDFGARLLDPRVGQWLSIDPLDAKFPDESPYSAMGNNPISNIDPDGRAYTSEKTEDENGNVTYTQTVTLAVLNRSTTFKGARGNNGVGKASMDLYLTQLKEGLDNTYSGTEVLEDGSTVTWRMNATVRIISDIDELDTRNKEHLIILQDRENSAGGSKLSDLVCTVNANAFFSQTKETKGAGLEGHELGHMFGLGHSDIATKNPLEQLVNWAMGYEGEGADTRNTVMDYDYVTNEELVAHQVISMYNNYKTGKLNGSYSNWNETAAAKYLEATDREKLEKISE